MRTDPARVRRLREQRAWSQEQLAEIAGINVRTLQRVESGGGGSLETRMALASALEVAPADLCESVAGSRAGAEGVAAADTGADTQPGPVAQAAADTPNETDDERASQLREIKLLLWALFVALTLILGYMFGRDLAQKHNWRDAQREKTTAQAPESPAAFPPDTRQQDDSRLSGGDASD